MQLSDWLIDRHNECMNTHTWTYTNTPDSASASGEAAGVWGSDMTAGRSPAEHSLEAFSAAAWQNITKKKEIVCVSYQRLLFDIE